jgi:hypothetical protein
MLPSDPFAGLLTIEKVKLSPSASVAERVIVLSVSSFVETACPAARGAAFGGETVIVNICVALVSTPPFAVPPSSVR